MRVRAFMLVVQLLIAADALALDSTRSITQYAQTHYETRDGMPHGFANSIAQTADGYLWTGSEEGLARFDGASFRIFDRRRTEGIPTNEFTALAVDPAGTLWAGTREHGILHLTEGEFRPVVWEAGPQAQQIRTMAFGREGDLWIGLRDRGLARLHNGTLVGLWGARDGLPHNDVRSMLAARDGTVWVGTFSGLARWRAGRILPGPAALAGVAVHAIAEDVHGELWCATANGLAHLRGDAVEIVGLQRLPTTDVRRILFDRDGTLWIGTGTGAARMSPSGQIDMLPAPASMILALFEDSEGNVWIGSEKGLDRLRDGDVLPFGTSEGTTDEPVFGVREDPAGTMWIASSGGLFRIAVGERTATLIVADHGTMFAIFPDSHGDIWFGERDGGVGRWRDDHFTWLGRRPWERVRSITETKEGIWLGTDQGLFQMHGDRLEDAMSMLTGHAISEVTPDPSGGLWIGTEGGGIKRWRDGKFLAVPAGGPPETAHVGTIQFEADGAMWVGTEGAGLWRLRDGHWFVFTAKNGMFDDVVWRILDDGRGNFWMSSNRGIWSVSQRELEQHAAGARATVESVVYGEGDGMRDRECNGAIEPSGWRGRDGRLWFPTAKGLAVIDPAHLHPSRPPTAVVENVRVDGQHHAVVPAIELAPGSSRIELAYTAPALRSPERLRFRYKLDGFDGTWNDAGTQRMAQYTNLAPGSYTFIVEAGADGKWGRAGKMAITLHPQFYQTRWFFVLAVLSVVLAIVAVPLLRVRQLRARARELDERVQEAIRELKVLSGLLPICAWCKKVRDDGGYWSKIEAYLSERTDAQFTHGICPDCNDKMLAEEGTSQPHGPAKTGGHTHAHGHGHSDRFKP
ncbi:MAG TPA: two-component regulator propeller domain-containing protein [Kofleriaceae bacterium]|nr:two-component regulator propeller domain-containing protein [Kofleriaceae bacterium]